MGVPTAIQTYLKVDGRWCYVYRAIDSTGGLCQGSCQQV